MKCRAVRSQIDLLRQDPAGKRAQEITRHIRLCEACGAYQARWQRMLDAFEQDVPEQPPPDLVHAVMQHIPARLDHPVAPRWLPLRPVVTAAILVCCVAGFWAVNHLQPLPRETVADAAGEHTVAAQIVRFSVDLPAARSVSLVGDFNQWNREVNPMQRDASGQWQVSLALGAGAYQYQFLVDGEVWQADPVNPCRVADGFGGFNSGIVL